MMEALKRDFMELKVESDCERLIERLTRPDLIQFEFMKALSNLAQRMENLEKRVNVLADDVHWLKKEQV